MKTFKNSGFTLMEMLTIVGIIIILASLILTGVTKAKKYAYKMTCMNNLKTLHSATLLYFQDYNTLPANDLINKIDTRNENELICPANRSGNNKLIVNNQTILLINNMNQFTNFDSTILNPLFSDVDTEAILLDPVNASLNYTAPHNGFAFTILTSGQFREFTISQIATEFSTATIKKSTTGKPAK